MTDQEYQQGVEAIKSGKIARYRGRTASTVAELDRLRIQTNGKEKAPAKMTAGQADILALETEQLRKDVQKAVEARNAAEAKHILAERNLVAMTAERDVLTAKTNESAADKVSLENAEVEIERLEKAVADLTTERDRLVADGQAKDGRVAELESQLAQAKTAKTSAGPKAAAEGDAQESK